jgi:hypothetical protein
VMEFADETPHLIPAVRIHVIGMGSRNDVRRAVLKRQATHGKHWAIFTPRHIPVNSGGQALSEGPIADVPEDRRLREDRGYQLLLDRDVRDIWWQDLLEWLRVENMSL